MYKHTTPADHRLPPQWQRGFHDERGDSPNSDVTASRAVHESCDVARGDHNGHRHLASAKYVTGTGVHIHTAGKDGGTRFVRPKTDDSVVESCQIKTAQADKDGARHTNIERTVNTHTLPGSQNPDSPADRPHDSAYETFTANGQYTGTSPDFDKIRNMCESNVVDFSVDISPMAFRQYRINNWPDFVFKDSHPEIAYIYDAVKSTGLPNALCARIPVTSGLNITAWEAYIGSDPSKSDLLDCIKYGFPIGYMGPISDTTSTPNHPSAEQYKAHVDSFVDKEMGLGAMQGPFPTPPFAPWSHVSPLMTRPKKDTEARRIISDMTYPSENSINAFIFKNTVNGIVRNHSLPTVQQAVSHLATVGNGAYLSSIDISRAYKNLVTDPADYPLLCLKWDSQYFLDLSVPFGSRASASHMQRVADVIVEILAKNGVYSRMYLDDLLIISPTLSRANKDYDMARHLLADLGLPEAKEKLQPPAHTVQWLGVDINARNMTISVPPAKLQEVKGKIVYYSKRRSMSRKQLQSLLGVLLHVAKCVNSARLFVSRLLDSLRAMKGKYLNINAGMRADLLWFMEFSVSWNGIGIIPKPHPTARTFFVDACGSGVGGTDGQQAYAAQVCPTSDQISNITHLEATNVVVALHTFISEKDRGSHICIKCDNEAAVQVFSNGKGTDRILTDAARACWMIQAAFDLTISYDHVPGKDNGVADALSRAHLSSTDARKAQNIINNDSLDVIKGCYYVFDVLTPSLLSRSGVRLLSDKSSREATQGKGGGYRPQPSIRSRTMVPVLSPNKTRPTTTHSSNDMCLHRTLNNVQQAPRDHRKQHQQHQSAPIPGGSRHQGVLPHQSDASKTGTREGQVHKIEQKTASTHVSPESNPDEAPRRPWRQSGKNGTTCYLPRRTEEIRSLTTECQNIPKYMAPHKRRHSGQQRYSDNSDKSCQKYAALQPEQNSDTTQWRRPADMPSVSSKGRPTQSSHHRQEGPLPHEPRQDHGPRHIHREDMARAAQRTRSPGEAVQPPLPPSGRHNGGI